MDGIFITDEEARQRDSFSCSIRHYTPQIMNQKQEGICEIAALTDMVTTSKRILCPAARRLALSPQVLLDAHLNRQDAVKFCMHKQYGLESLRTYQFLRYARAITDFSERNYQMIGRGRHTLHSINYLAKPKNEVEHTEEELAEIKDTLIGMFSDTGYKLPCVGGLRLGPLFDRRYAAQFSPTNPYRHEVEADNEEEAQILYGDPHAVLIVGVDTTSENPLNHSVEIKNSYGTKWGKDGFCWVSFDVFDYIIIPVVKKDEDHP